MSKAEPSASGPFKATVQKYDARRGVATLVDERGRLVRVAWEVLKHAPILSRGMQVVIIVDEKRRATKINCAA